MTRSAATATHITLLPATPSLSPGTLLARWPGEIVACDCYVEGAEHGTPVPGG